MNTIQRLEKMWEQDRRYTARYMLVVAGSLFFHAVLAVMFALAGRFAFAALNVGSLGFYVLWAFLFARKPVNAWMLLSLYFDVVLHACIYNLALGQGPAFFLYPFIIIPVTFFLSTRDLKNVHALFASVLLSILSVLLMLATLSPAPWAPFADSGLTDQFFQVNMLICVLLLSVYTSEFMTETLNTQKSLSFHAENDQLTGLRNRYGFAKEVERLHGTQYCVVMGDIDDFKQVNDRYGHTVGDLLLSKVGQVLRASVGREDSVCRWGGEEFLMVLCCDLDTARAAVERVRRKLAAVTVETGDSAASVTMTFGLADCLEAESFSDLVRVADANLLRGKRAGKNCVVLSTDSGEPAADCRSQQTQLDTAFLDSPIFSAFSATSDTTYIYMCNLQNNVSRWSRTAVDYFGLPG
ncbi:MAG: GGDEF domain-containing protein, partial [Faecousia sp.]